MHVLFIAALTAFAAAPQTAPQRDVVPRAQQVSVDGINVTLTPLLPAVERPVRMPVVVTATSAQPGQRAVHVEVCASYRCTGADDASVDVNEGAATLDAIVWPPGMQAHVRAGNVEQWTQPSRMTSRVVAVTTEGDAYTLRYGPDGRDGALVVVPVGSLLKEKPELAMAFGAVVVTNPDAVADDVRTSGDVLVVEGSGDGRAAIDDLVADRPGFVHFLEQTGIDELPVVHAASAGLSMRPPRAPAFLLALAAVIVIAVLVRRGGKSGRIGRALALSSAVAVGSSIVLVVFQLAVIPSELHARVVAWMGPDGAWETGADAVRPRDTTHVVVHTPAAPSGVTFVGSSDIVDAHTTPTGAEATVPSSSALVAVWQRPSPMPRAVALVGDGVYENRLDRELDAVAFGSTSRVVLHVPAHARFSIADAKMSDERPPVSLAEERLLFEITNACRVRTTTAGVAQAECDAAVTHEPDGTVLGIEVSQ